MKNYPKEKKRRGKVKSFKDIIFLKLPFMKGVGFFSLDVFF